MKRIFALLLLSSGVAWGQGSFTFTITADSHLDDRTDRNLYQRTLQAAAADKPAFHVEMGDTFMSEKLPSREAAARQYRDQRGYFDVFQVPVHIVIGNHDGESGRYLDGTTNNLAMWSRAMRLHCFPEPLAGDGRNYYAWERGPALFVVLDPYWFTPRQRRDDDNWVRTLGKGQYDWLARTLRGSRAAFKFVFIHQLVGGLEGPGRGGIEAAPFFEWGGRGRDGAPAFAAKRPGWEKPIHDLLVETRVSAVFHGHDHFYARQELDGIIYQLVPQPGFPGERPPQAEEYGYRAGEFLPSSGYLRVSVASTNAVVEYVRVGPGPSAPRVMSRYLIPHRE